MKLIATKTRMYGTRHLTAGDPFDAPGPIARVLIKIGHAKADSDDVRPSVPGTEVPAATVEALRAEYERLTGDAPDGRWGEKRLADEIAKGAKS